MAKKNRNTEAEVAVSEVADETAAAAEPTETAAVEPKKAKKKYPKNDDHWSVRLGPNTTGKFLTIQTLRLPRVVPPSYIARTIVFDGPGKEAKRTYGNTASFSTFEDAKAHAVALYEGAVAAGWPVVKQGGRVEDAFQGVPGMDF